MVPGSVLLALKPHYIQTAGQPAVAGAGYGVLGCSCGESLLISGYEPRNFLGISIQCAACGKIAVTPGLPPLASVPPAVTIVERGTTTAPPMISADTVLIGREEADRLAAFYEPRRTDADLHTIGDAMLDDVEFQQRRWTELPLDPSPAGYTEQPLAWAVAHFRAKPAEWTRFAENADMVALTTIAAFRDLFAAWSHHPLFPAMIRTAAADGFTLHAAAMFATAKAIALSGTRILFETTGGPRPTIAGLRLGVGGDAQMNVDVVRFDRYEWPGGEFIVPAAVRSAVTQAVASVQGRINRLRPGMLVLSAGATDGVLDQILLDSVAAAIGSQGKRNRGLAVVAAILPRVALTGRPREARFGFNFYPVPNRAFAAADSVRIGTRAGDLARR